MSRFSLDTLESRQFLSVSVAASDAPVAAPTDSIRVSLSADSTPTTAALTAATAPTTLTSATLAATLKNAVAEVAVPGVVAAVINPGQPLISAAAGVRARGFSAPVKLTDSFHIGSNLKAFTATLAARLVEQGRVSWDSTLGEVAPELNGVIKDRYLTVTLEQILSHRAAIPDLADLPQDLLTQVLSYRKDGRAQRAKFIPEFLKYDSTSSAGEFQYSNIGYATAGYLLERATGKSFDTLLKQEVFKPLGIKSASFASPGSNNPRRADAPRGHDADGKPLLPRDQYVDQPLLAPAGLYSMTIADFARFASVHLGDTPKGFSTAKPFLTPASLTKLHTPVGGDIATAVGGPSGQQYALGWSVTTVDGHTVLSHDGSNDYWLSRATLDLSSGTATVLACNQLSSGEEAIGDALLNNITADLAPVLDAIAAPERERRATLSTLNQVTEAARTSANVPGLIASVLTPDGSLLTAVSGNRQRNANTPFLPTDTVVIGSCGKAMTSTLAALLVEKKMISFSTTLAQSFPDIPGVVASPYANVTLEQLLNHTGGFQREPAEILNTPPFSAPAIARFFGTDSPTRQRERLVAASVKLAPAGPVGESNYSNAGYSIAGAMLERAVGKSYESLMYKYIFNPLGMKSVKLGSPGSNNPRVINAPRGHDADGKPLLPREQIDPVYESPAGAFCMTVPDWAKFIRAQLGQPVNGVRLLSDAQLGKLQTPNANGEGLGWGVATIEDVTVLAHAGSNGAWIATVAVVPSTGKALFVVANQIDPAGADAVTAVTDNADLRAYLVTP